MIEFVKSRHSGENRSPAFYNYLKLLDPGFRRGDRKGYFRLFTSSSKIDFVGEPHPGLPLLDSHSGPPLRKPFMAEDFKYEYDTLLDRTGFLREGCPPTLPSSPFGLPARSRFGEGREEGWDEGIN